MHGRRSIGSGKSIKLAANAAKNITQATWVVVMSFSRQKMSKLDREEQEILEAFDKGQLKRSKKAAAQIKDHRVVAEATFKKDARINIRLSSRDLRAIQSRALKEGVPYQTLVSSVLHKYVDGQLVEKNR